MSGDFDNVFTVRTAARCRDIQTLKVQYVVRRAESGSLPGISSVWNYFWQLCYWPVVSVEETEDGLLVTLRELWVKGHGCFFSPGDLLDPAQKNLHTVDGRCVRVDLVVPDGYGCKVTVTQGLLEVNVRHDVINRITCDEQLRNSFLSHKELGPGDALSVCYASTGCISIKRMSPDTYDCGTEWLWAFFIIRKLIELLRPFKGEFPTGPLPVRDRCVDKCSSRSVQGVSSPDTSDCHTDVFVKLNKQSAMIKRERFFSMMNAEYPGLSLSYDTDQLTLKLSGGDDAAEKATKHILGYISNLSSETIPLTDIQAMMLNKTDAQNLFQLSLDSKDVDCDWKLEHVRTEDTPPRRRSWFLPPTLKLNDQTVILVTAVRSEINRFQQAFLSCFQTAEVDLGNSVLPHLQSESWRRFQYDLQKPHGNKIAPVLKVDQDKIRICDEASSIDTTRKAVSDFFHGCLVKEHPEFNEQETEFITDLHPWQMNFLITAQDKKRLPAFFQQTVSVNSEMNAVCISAPRHVLKTCVCDFWKYVAYLSRDNLKLTAASAQVLLMSDNRTRVQSLLDQEGVCDWHVKQGRLVFSAQHSHMQQLEDIFVSEIATIQRALGPQTNHQEDTELQSEDSTGDQHQIREQQTGNIHTEDEGDLAEITPETSSLSPRFPEREGTSGQLTPVSNSSAFSPVSSPGLERAQRSPDAIPQQPGSSRGPRNRALPPPRVLEGHPYSEMTSAVHEPPGSDRPPRRAQRFGNPRYVPYNRAGTCAHNSRPSAESRPGLGSCGHSHRDGNERGRQLEQSPHVVETIHDELASLTAHGDYQQHLPRPANTTTNVTRINNSLNRPKSLLDSSVHARLTMLEHAHMNRQRDQEPAVRLETQVINIQQQLDRIMQCVSGPRHHDSARISMLEHLAMNREPAGLLETRVVHIQQKLDNMTKLLRGIHQQHHGSGSDFMELGNPSETTSVSSASSSLVSALQQQQPQHLQDRLQHKQQQRQLQQQQQQHLPQRQRQQQQQHQPRQLQHQQHHDSGAPCDMEVFNPSDPTSVSSASS